MQFFKVLSVIICVFMLSACSGDKKDASGLPSQSVEEMYNEGIKNLEKKNYTKAIENFEDLQRTYPYSKLATKSEIMSAYTSYKDDKYEDAIATLDRFIKLHPGNEDIQYAYYLKALSYYEQISDITKDQGYSVYARDALQEVVTRFPNTRYANDAKLKIDLVNDHLAGKEVDVGRYYLKQGNYLAAINRFQQVIKKYDTTAHVPEALHRLVECYMALGVRDEATKYASVLGYNFPESKWYAQSYKLIEGKRLRVETAEETAGKWYDYKSWKGMIFRKSEPPVNDGVVGRSLIDDVDRNVKEAPVAAPQSVAPAENQEPQEDVEAPQE